MTTERSRTTGTSSATKDDDFEALVATLYDNLRGVAHFQLRRLRPGQTLDTTSLVNEAYLKLARAGSEYVDRGHFLAASARAMRHILVNAARDRVAAKRGGGVRPETFDDASSADTSHSEYVLAVSEALERLEAFDARMCSVVDCRFYAGMTEAETGEALGVSERTVRRDWLRARAWLHDELSTDE